MPNKKGQSIGTMSFIMIFGFIFLIAIFGFRIVDYNTYAFESEFGTLKQEMMHTGINYVGIGSKVTVNNQIRNYEMQIDTASKDLQTVKMDLNLNVRLKQDQAYNFLKNYPNEDTYKQYLNNKIQEKLKTIVLKYNAEETLHNRINISEEMNREVKTIKELDYFEVNDIVIKNIEFSDEFNAQLERKAQVDVEREIIIKQKENMELTKKNIDQIDIDKYVKFQIVEKWDGKSALILSDNFIGGVNK